MMTSLRKNYLVGTPAKYSNVEESLHTKEPMDINGRQFKISEYGACPIVEEQHSQMKGEEKVDEEIVVKKVLISLPMRFNAKISAIEEKDLYNLKLEEQHKILITYEMRIRKKR